MIRCCSVFAFGAFCLVATSRAHATDLPVGISAEASVAWAENISHTSATADRKSAVRYEAAAAASLLHEWAGRFVTVAEFGATLDSVPDYPKAGALVVGPQLNVRKKIGLGAFAPVIDASVGYRYRDARVSFDDGWSPTASIRVAKRITPAWRVSTSVDWSQHDGKNATFDTSQHRAFAEVTWDPTSRVQLSYGVGRLWGAVLANAAWPVWARAISGQFGAKVNDYYNSIPWVTSEIYGPLWVSYRVEGFANFQWFEISPALGRNTSLPLRYERMNTINKIGIAYPQEIWSLSLLHRF